MVLRTSCCKELELRSLVSRLGIVLEAYVVGSPQSSNGQDPPHQVSVPNSRDMIWSSAVDTAEEPVIIIQQRDGYNARPCVYAIWKISAVLRELLGIKTVAGPVWLNGSQIDQNYGFSRPSYYFNLPQSYAMKTPLSMGFRKTLTCLGVYQPLPTY